jgi:hypothetical protein
MTLKKKKIIVGDKLSRLSWVVALYATKIIFSYLNPNQMPDPRLAAWLAGKLIAASVTSR